MSGHLYVDPEERDAYLAGSLEVMRQARGAAGCLDFVLTADPLEPGRIHIYEQWESDAHLEAFRDTGPDAGQQAQIRETHVRRYQISSVEAP